MSTGKSIAKGAAIVMAATLFSRLFGFIREMVIARYFGLSGATDAYLVAFSVPNGIALAVAAAISSGYIPVLSTYITTEDKENELTVSNSLFNILLLVLTVIVALTMVFTPSIVKILAPGFSTDSQNLTIELARIMFPALIFVSLMGFASGYLNSKQHFLFPAAGPAVTSLLIILSSILLAPFMGIKSLAIGTLAGFMGQLFVQIPMLYRKGYRYKFVLNLHHPGVVKSLKLMGPVLIASLAPAMLLLVERGLASNLVTGSISALNYAYRLLQLPLGLFVMAVTVPLFPALSNLAAKKEYGQLRQTIVNGSIVLAVIMFAATALMVALDAPIVRLLFEGGQFKASDTQVTASALALYALALFPLALRDILRRGFYALQNTFTPVIITVLAFGLNVILDIVFIRILGVRGLALGAATSAFIETIILYMLLGKKLDGMIDAQFVKSILKLIVISVLTGLVAWFSSLLIGQYFDLSRTINRILQVGISGLLGVVVYGIGLFLFRIDVLVEFYKELSFRKKRLV